MVVILDLVTNSVQVLQGDASFILQDEMPNTAAPFLDKINIKGPPTHYETTEDGWYTSTAFMEPLPQSHTHIDHSKPCCSPLSLYMLVSNTFQNACVDCQCCHVWGAHVYLIPSVSS